MVGLAGLKRGEGNGKRESGIGILLVSHSRWRTRKGIRERAWLSFVPFMVRQACMLTSDLRSFGVKVGVEGLRRASAEFDPDRLN